MHVGYGIFVSNHAFFVSNECTIMNNVCNEMDNLDRLYMIPFHTFGWYTHQGLTW